MTMIIWRPSIFGICSTWPISSRSALTRSSWPLGSMRNCSAYPACGPDVTRAGGRYADIPVDQAVVDGNLVTAPAWPAHPQWLAAFLKVLGTKIEHGA